MVEKLLSPETYSLLVEWMLNFCKNAIVAIIVYFIGSWIIKWGIRLITKMLERSKVEKSLYTFLTSIVNVVAWFLLIIVIVSILGIETSSFIALFASAGVAIGMALSGTLQNFAGGVMILLFKPFKVGDFIEAQGYAGVVKEIQIFNTIIRTGDAQIIIIPNGGLSTGTMKNSTKEPYREVRQAIADIIEANPLVLKGPVADSEIVAAPWYGLGSLGDSGVVIKTRSWCKGEDYWAVYFGLNETIYQTLKERGFMFPFNRMDVTILNK